MTFYNRFTSLGADSVGDLSKLQAVANTVSEFLPVGKGNAIDYKMVVKPLLSRVKCVYLQFLNKKRKRLKFFGLNRFFHKCYLF